MIYFHDDFTLHPLTLFISTIQNISDLSLKYSFELPFIKNITSSGGMVIVLFLAIQY